MSYFIFRRARPVITVVDARPMSEVGFSGTSFGQPSNNSNQLGSNVSSNRPSVANQSGNVVQPANNDCGRPPARMPPPRPQAPPISVAESTAKPKPEPKPRPRSMMIPKSTSLSVLNQELVSPQDRQAPHEKSEQLRKPPAAGRPTIIRPQVLRPSVGTNDSDVFDQQEMIATGADKKKPPVLKPKPSALLRHGSLTDLPAREAENNMMGGAGIAVDNARRKPTIIRPSPQVTGPSSQHPVATHRHVQAPATLADAKDSLKTVVPPLPSKQYADSSKAAEQADCCTNTVSEVANKQGRAKPTIIRMNKVPVLDSSVNFAVSGNSNAGSLQKEEKLDNQGNDQCGIQQTDICHLNSVSASSSTPEIENIKNHALEDTHCNKRIDASASCGVRPKLPPAAGKPPVGVASHISDMPHSQAEQHVHATHPVLEPVKSLPPTKPPPPRNAATRTTSHSVSAAEYVPNLVTLNCQTFSCMNRQCASCKIVSSN